MSPERRDGAPRLRVVQPWFTAPGHPAQTLLATARALCPEANVRFAIPAVGLDGRLRSVARQLEAVAPLDRYPSPSPHFVASTAWALRWLAKDAERLPALLLDGHLATVAAAWRLPGFRPESGRLGILYVAGPERISRLPALLGLVRGFVSQPTHRLFLRTAELAEAWREALGARAAGHVDTLPSLELPRAAEETPPRSDAGGGVRFLVAGQVRPGKGLERLVPLFTAHPELGNLTVAGAFADAAARAALPMLQGFAGFREGVLPEVELLGQAAAADYLVMLYDHWDARMEAATLYLAARAGRPAIVFDAGWCGRMLRTYRCGIAVPPGADLDAVFASVPPPGSEAYRSMVQGTARFAEAHAPDRLRNEFLRKVAG